MTTRKESIIEKIQALMARANHPTANEHEAVACAAKAAELMQKYGVESSDLQEKAVITHAVVKTKQAPWIESLAAIIRDAFGVRVVLGNKGEFTFIGESVNLDVVLFIFEQLRNKIDSLSKQYVKEWYSNFQKEHRMSYEQYTSKGAKQSNTNYLVKSYCHGILIELKNKLVQVNTPEYSQVQGLVLVRNEINNYMYNVLGMKTRMTKGRRSYVNTDVVSDGRSAGRNININSGLGSKTGQKLLG